jgi:hypothetical protein
MKKNDIKSFSLLTKRNTKINTREAQKDSFPLDYSSFSLEDSSSFESAFRRLGFRRIGCLVVFAA